MTSADDPGPRHASDPGDLRRAPGTIRGPMAAVVAGFLIAIAFSVLYTTWSVDQSQHRWCSALVTLDNAGHHAPPPTSKFGRQLVTDFHNLKAQFGCAA